MIEGIRYNDELNDFEFDFKEDLNSDIIKLKIQQFNKVFASRHGMNVYIAYKMNNKAKDKSHKSQIRNKFKYMDFSESEKRYVYQMITKSIILFDKLDDLSTYDIIVSPSSGSKLLHGLVNTLSAKAGHNTSILTDKIIKNTFDNIKFNGIKIEKLNDPSSKQKMELYKKLKKADENGFSMKKVPPALRGKIENFLVFDNDIDRRIYNKMYNGKIIVVDDVYTSGTTLKEINTLLSEQQPKQITNYIFLAGS